MITNLNYYYQPNLLSTERKKMIKIFRRIRQQLLSENKISRYGFYAVGEIILVVIGILIALQINNWNEKRKEKFIERELLTYTIENLKTDSLSLVSLIDKTNSILQLHEDLIHLSEGKIQETDIVNLDFIRASEPRQIITKKNNPDLPNEVKSQELKKTILDYFLSIDWLDFTILNNNQIIEQSLRPFLGEKKLLNYGYQWERDLSHLNLINRERFFVEFKNEDIQQIGGESGMKLSRRKRSDSRTPGK